MGAPIASTRAVVTMPLGRCPECDREFLDGASICPHCGQPTDPDREKVKRKLLSAYNIGCLTILLLLALAFGYSLVGMLS